MLSIITNGILIDEDIVKFMKEELTEGVQIPIDGLSYHHNKKRITMNGDGSYDRIVANVKILQDAGVAVKRPQCLINNLTEKQSCLKIKI